MKTSKGVDLLITTRREKTKHLTQDRQLLDEGEINSSLQRITQEILERCTDPKKLLLVGIRTGGVFLTERLRQMLVSRVGHDIKIGAMDITLYRDDVLVDMPRPEVGPTELPCMLEGHTVILVDDVLFTGRTVRAALVELMDFGRPAGVQLAVLIDRGHRELPIQADYVGFQIQTTREESVLVFFHELGQNDRVVLFRRKG